MSRGRPMTPEGDGREPGVPCRLSEYPQHTQALHSRVPHRVMLVPPFSRGIERANRGYIVPVLSPARRSRSTAKMAAAGGCPKPLDPVRPLTKGHSCTIPQTCGACATRLSDSGQARSNRPGPCQPRPRLLPAAAGVPPTSSTTMSSTVHLRAAHRRRVTTPGNRVPVESGRLQTCK